MSAIAEINLPGFITVRQAAAVLGVHRQWVYELINRGQLQAYRTLHGLLVAEADVAAFQKRREGDRRE